MKSAHSTRTRPMPGMHSLRGLMASMGAVSSQVFTETAGPSTVDVCAQAASAKARNSPVYPQLAAACAAEQNANKGLTQLVSASVKTPVLTPSQQQAVAAGKPAVAAAVKATVKAPTPAAASSNQTLLIAGGAVGLAALAAVAYKLHAG